MRSVVFVPIWVRLVSGFLIIGLGLAVAGLPLTLPWGRFDYIPEAFWIVFLVCVGDEYEYRRNQRRRYGR